MEFLGRRGRFQVNFNKQLQSRPESLESVSGLTLQRGLALEPSLRTDIGSLYFFHPTGQALRSAQPIFTKFLIVPCRYYHYIPSGEDSPPSRGLR